MRLQRREIAIDQSEREYQEDAFFELETDQFAAFGVCDGHGGQCGLFVAERFQFYLSHIPYYFHPKYIKGIYDQVVLDWIICATQARLDGDDRFSESGSTLTGIIIDKVYGVGIVFHIGDSNLIVSNNRKVLFSTSKANLDKIAIRKRLMAKVGYPCAHKDGKEWYIKSRDGNQYLNMSAAIGDYFSDGLTEALDRTLNIELVRLAKDNYILLCTDGLSDVMTNDEMSISLLQGNSAQDFVDYANNQSKKDNVTCILIQV